MANDGNGTESSFSGADPMEKIMERVVSFLQTLQNNITNGLPEHRERPTTIKQFQDLKPSTFTGDSNPLLAEAWVKEMEKIFHALPCTEEQKVSFATFTLKEDAQEWWFLTLEKEKIVTWAKFLEVFYEKCSLESLQVQKASEFLHLRQGTMSIAEYETEAQKARKFEAVLDVEIKDKVQVRVITIPKGSTIPNCPSCRKTHQGQCYQAIGACYRCDQVGHLVKDCPKFTNSVIGTPEPVQKLGTVTRMRKEQKHPRKAFALVPRNSNAAKNVVSGTLSICDHSAHILIDFESTHSCVSPHFTPKLTSTLEPLGYALAVSFPSGVSALSTKVYKSYAISLKDETLYVDLTPLRISRSYIILGMDWLAANHASIYCTTKKVFL
ncbi:uncharacterized protein LOC114301494 [Camellia sinensis]|uniref:uncharacterized protein LOC114301494 n=1 Tax=Camellia sinensis TaxID=4442 RepID=UPI0010356FAA|nr:uncharacterized protein LOC114301494 [Camellia sinensis]